MTHDNGVLQYRERLMRLSYLEYAQNHADDTHKRDGRGEQNLNLSLWNDSLPPGVTEAAMRALPRVVGAYSLAQDQILIDLLAERLRTAGDNIIVTAGADDALRVVSQYCIRPGTRTLIPIPSFGRYTYHAMVGEAKIYYLRFDVYPYELDVAKINDEVHKKKVECLFVASPNNPTGHALSRESIKLLLDTVSCSVVLDESLLLTACGASSSELVNEYQNLFVCGSFSKLYGLPGLRVGYLVANRSYAEGLRKLVSPFGVDAFGLEIAKHVVTQDDWLRERTKAIGSGIAILRGIDSPQLRVTRTSAPVALVEYTGAGGNLYRMLRAQGVATIASEEFPGLDKTNAVRVIIKNVKDMLRLKRILTNIS